jgi:hypothetical protein
MPGIIIPGGIMPGGIPGGIIPVRARNQPDNERRIDMPKQIAAPTTQTATLLEKQKAL